MSRLIFYREKATLLVVCYIQSRGSFFLRQGAKRVAMVFKN